MTKEEKEALKSKMSAVEIMAKIFITPLELEFLYGISTSNQEKQRVDGKLKYRKALGKVLYKLDEIHDLIDECVVA